MTVSNRLAGVCMLAAAERRGGYHQHGHFHAQPVVIAVVAATHDQATVALCKTGQSDGTAMPADKIAPAAWLALMMVAGPGTRASARRYQSCYADFQESDPVVAGSLTKDLIA